MTAGQGLGLLLLAACCTATGLLAGGYLSAQLTRRTIRLEIDRLLDGIDPDGRAAIGRDAVKLTGRPVSDERSYGVDRDWPWGEHGARTMSPADWEALLKEGPRYVGPR